MKKVHIITYGCQMNIRDSEAMRGFLVAAGYTITDHEEDADIVILNTCSVRDQAEVKALGKLNQLLRYRLRRPHFRLGVTGCMAQNRGESLFSLVRGLDFVLGTRQSNRLIEVLQMLEQGESKICFLGEESSQCGSSVHQITPQQASAFVTIATGCNMRCSYCIVPYTRGPEVCRPMNEIVQEVQSLVNQGIKEVTLLGQIVNQYGVRVLPMVDGKTPFVQLLEKLNAIEGLHRIRFLSPHPIGFHQDLIDCYKNLPKLCPAVHLPVQSGSNRILKLMKRGYTAERALELVQQLRAAHPDMSISTDVIVGYPDEQEEDFQATLRLFKELDLDMAFVFKYSPRKGTPAAIAPNQIPEEVKEERNQILLDVLAISSRRRNEAMVGRVQEVLFERPSKKNPKVLVGFTPNAKKVFVEAPQSLIGTLQPVRITKASVTCLNGELLV